MKMNGIFPHIVNDSNEGSIIHVESTSTVSASVSPFVLKHSDTDVTRIVLEPSLIENSKDNSKSVEVKLIYEKRKKGNNYPTESITPRIVKVGEVMELPLDTTATHSLYRALSTLYDLYEEHGIPYGQATYKRIDSIFQNFLDIIQQDPSAARMIGNKDNFKLVKELLRLITQTDSTESLAKALQNLQSDSISNLSDTLNFERLSRAISLIERNLTNNREEFWQKDVFTEYQWVLAQLFSSPCTIFQEKAYVGGKSISNKNGNICDFLYQNKISSNIILIEIKTPQTKIIQTSYRDTYSFTTEMSGAVNQVLNYRDSLMKEYNNMRSNTNESFVVFNPKCVVVIGQLSGMNQGQCAAFENFRNSLNNIEIITFDEILQRLKDLRGVFSKDYL